MNRPTIATIIIIVCLLIIGLYASGEVNYYSSKISMERNVDSPTIIIPSAGINEKINEETLDLGVLHGPTSYKDYQLSANEGGNYIYLVTCDPIGSTENRLIIQGELSQTNPINEQIIKDNPQESNAYIISALFLVIGLAFSFFYSKDQRIYILATVLIISALLFYFCLFPIPSEIIYDKINFLNGGM